MEPDLPTIFVVSEYVDPKINSTGYYWSKIINGISVAFSKVAVICPKSSQTDQYPFESNRVSVYLISQSSYNKNHLLLRLFGLLNFSLKFVIKIVQRVKKSDLIFSGTNPIFLLLCIALTKKFIQFKWVLLVHDVFPDNLASAGILKKSNLFYKFLDYLFRWAYRSADALLVIGRDMEALFRQKKMTGPLIYQPNWVNKHEITPILKSQSKLIQGLGWDGKVVFQFFGNAGRLQGINNLLSAIQGVTDSRAAFLFIGEGSEFGAIQQFANAHPELPIALVSNSELNSRNDGLAACDVALVSLINGMQGIGVPSKIYFSLAADRPILGVVDGGSELAQMINEHQGIGWTCEPDNPQKLAAIIDHICKLDLASNVGKARSAMEERYDELPAIKRYIESLNLVLEINKSA